MNIKRSEAAAFLEKIRQIAAEGTDGTAAAIRELFEAPPYTNTKGPLPSIPNLQPCGGEAHSNAFIDNCGRCAPRWGWVGPTIKVR